MRVLIADIKEDLLNPPKPDPSALTTPKWTLIVLVGLSMTAGLVLLGALMSPSTIASTPTSLLGCVLGMLVCPIPAAILHLKDRRAPIRHDTQTEDPSDRSDPHRVLHSPHERASTRTIRAGAPKRERTHTGAA